MKRYRTPEEIQKAIDDYNIKVEAMSVEEMESEIIRRLTNAGKPDSDRPWLRRDGRIDRNHFHPRLVPILDRMIRDGRVKTRVICELPHKFDDGDE